MIKRRRNNTIFVFLVFFCILSFSKNALGVEKKIVDIKNQNVYFEVPVSMPPEQTEGIKEKGAVIFETRSERGMFERLFAVYWGKERTELSGLFPSDRYKLFTETPMGAIEVKANGHDATFMKSALSITYPCGQQTDGNIVTCRFYCDKTKRHFLLLSFLTTVTEKEFVEVIKTLKCH